MTTKVPAVLISDQVFGRRRLNINGDIGLWLEKIGGMQTPATAQPAQEQIHPEPVQPATKPAARSAPRSAVETP